MAEKTEKEKFGCKILKCSCMSKFQDEEYGIFQRVHNWGPKHRSFGPGYACTICGSLKK